MERLMTTTLFPKGIPTPWISHHVHDTEYTLPHWGRVTHICVSELCHHCFRWCVLIGAKHFLNQWSDNVNWSLGTNFSEILIKVCRFSFTKMHFIMSSVKWPFCLGLKVLTGICAANLDTAIADSLLWAVITPVCATPTPVSWWKTSASA